MTSERDSRSLISYLPQKWRNTALQWLQRHVEWLGATLWGLRIHAFVHLLTYLLTYLGSWLCAYKIGNVSETAEDRVNDRPTINGLCMKSYTDFRLPPKCMTMNDLWARFKVLDSLNAAKMTKYILVMTPTPYIVAGCIMSIRPTYSAPVHLLTLGV